MEDKVLKALEEEFLKTGNDAKNQKVFIDKQIKRLFDLIRWLEAQKKAEKAKSDVLKKVFGKIAGE